MRSFSILIAYLSMIFALSQYPYKEKIPSPEPPPRVYILHTLSPRSSQAVGDDRWWGTIDSYTNSPPIIRPGLEQYYRSDKDSRCPCQGTASTTESRSLFWSSNEQTFYLLDDANGSCRHISWLCPLSCQLLHIPNLARCAWLQCEKWWQRR